MLRYAHFYMKGGLQSFAALCAEVRCADKAALRRLQRPTIVGSQKTDGLARSQLETRGIDSIMFFVGLSCQNPEYP
jgi:hypothetical protein